MAGARTKPPKRRRGDQIVFTLYSRAETPKETHSSTPTHHATHTHTRRNKRLQRTTQGMKNGAAPTTSGGNVARLHMHGIHKADNCGRSGV